MRLFQDTIEQPYEGDRFAFSKQRIDADSRGQSTYRKKK